MIVIIEEMSTFLGMLQNKKNEENRPFYDEKFATFYQFSHDRKKIASIWVWFSNKVLNDNIFDSFLIVKQ